jgi:hypothetical protein
MGDGSSLWSPECSKLHDRSVKTRDLTFVIQNWWQALLPPRAAFPDTAHIDNDNLRQT